MSHTVFFSYRISIENARPGGSSKKFTTFTPTQKWQGTWKFQRNLESPSLRMTSLRIRRGSSLICLQCPETHAIAFGLDSTFWVVVPHPTFCLLSTCVFLRLCTTSFHVLFLLCRSRAKMDDVDRHEWTTWVLKFRYRIWISAKIMSGHSCHSHYSHYLCQIIVTKRESPRRYADIRSTVHCGTTGSPAGICCGRQFSHVSRFTCTTKNKTYKHATFVYWLHLYSWTNHNRDDSQTLDHTSNTWSQSLGPKCR